MKAAGAMGAGREGRWDHEENGADGVEGVERLEGGCVPGGVELRGDDVANEGCDDEERGAALEDRGVVHSFRPLAHAGPLPRRFVLCFDLDNRRLDT
eukprot:612761-Rhodomonas_salina.1